MMNSTPVSYFTLTAYFDIGLLKYGLFVIILCFYIVTVFANLLLIRVICINRSLHKPMYLFLGSLFFNQLIGSTSLFPFLLTQILADIHTVSVHLCFLQIYFIHTYGTTEYILLSLLAYDRYFAICFPFQYSSRMTGATVSKMLTITWTASMGACTFMISLSSTRQLCGNVINKVYCDNYSVVRLSCSNPLILNVNGLIATFSTILFPLLIIGYSYTKILIICRSGCKESRQKAIRTCSPHLISLANFALGSSFEILQSRFNMGSWPMLLRVFLSLYWLTIQLLLNPLIYGLRLSKLRRLLLYYAFKRKEIGKV